MSTKPKRRETQQFPVPPEGLYQAVCADVWDIWTEPDNFNPGAIKDVLRIVWEINKVCKEAPLVGKPYQVSQKYTASMHKKSNLRRDIESWFGKTMTDDQAYDLDPGILVGYNCQLQVVHNVGSNGVTYANVKAVVPLAKGMVKMRVSPDFVTKKERDKEARKAGHDARQAPPVSDEDYDKQQGIAEDDDESLPF